MIRNRFITSLTPLFSAADQTRITYFSRPDTDIVHRSRMAFYREMDAVGRDPARFVLLAKQCLYLPDLTDWERDFLQSLVARPPDRLSTRQAEVLFEIRDDNELHSHLNGGFSVAILIQRAYQGRRDLDEGDEEWIAEIWKSGKTSLRRRHLGRLRRCCAQLGELEPA